MEFRRFAFASCRRDSERQITSPPKSYCDRELPDESHVVKQQARDGRQRNVDR